VAAGRMHRRADIYRAVPILREAGIRNISFDLIAGLPHQTKESWRTIAGGVGGAGARACFGLFAGIDVGAVLVRSCCRWRQIQRRSGA